MFCANVRLTTKQAKIIPYFVCSIKFKNEVLKMAEWILLKFYFISLVIGSSSCIFAIPIRAISSAGSEHLVYTEGVGGSNPSSPTIRELTNFLVKSLLFLPRKPLLILAISFKIGFKFVVRTFLFSK